jgi:hypothetical protein
MLYRTLMPVPPKYKIFNDFSEADTVGYFYCFLLALNNICFSSLVRLS